MTPGLRGALPPKLSQFGRQAYLGVGTATATLRMQPSFLLLGASRCGTTSLFRALSAHPGVLRPAANKGVRYFDLNYFRGWDWYRGHFPLTAPARLRAGWGSGGDGARGPVTFEASGYYVFHPTAVQRIAADLPDARLVVMVRDPVERAYSGWKHESARGFESESFERALELEDERLAGEVERITADPRYESHAHRHQSHRCRGEYADQLDRVLTVFPQDQLYVMQSEAFFTEPQREYHRLLNFLGLPAHDPGGFAVHNARPSAPMPDGLRRRLAEHYAPFNHRLEFLLGEPLRWG